MLKRVTVALVIAWLGAAPLGAAPASVRAVHTQLEASVPAAGDTLGVAPAELVLTFGGLIEASGARVRLLGPADGQWTLEVSRAGESARVLRAPLPALPRGGYRVEWRVISGDGHPVSGDFVFFVTDEAHGGGDPLELAPPPPSSAAGPGAAGSPEGGERSSAWPLSVRAVADGAMLTLAGLLVFAFFGGAVPAPRTVVVARGLAALTPALAAIYAWLWAGSVVGGDAAARLGALSALHTGRARAAEVVLAALVPWALLLARRPRIAAAFAFLAVGAGAFAGHAASHTPLVSVPASALHQAAAAAWLGGLLFLSLEAGRPEFLAAAHRVSRAALVAVAVVAGTGLLQTWMLVDSFATLTGSRYGLLLAAKVTGLVGLIAFGAHNRFRLLPRAGGGDGAGALATSVRWELGLAYAVVAVAAVLSHVPPNP